MIRNFSKSIEKKRGAIEILIDDMKFEVQLSKKKERSEAFLDDKKMRLDAKRAESYKTIVNAKNCLEPFTHDLW